MHGRYRIKFVQQIGTWQPHKPSKKARDYLQQANRVYSLPSTEQKIKWMHAVCAYPVKSTWLAAVKAGNYLTLAGQCWKHKTSKKYFPETMETPKIHLNQSHTTHEVNKAQTITICDRQHDQIERQEGTRCLFEGVQRTWNDLLRSNRAISDTVTVRQRLPHDHGGHWQEWNTSRTNEPPKRR